MKPRVMKPRVLAAAIVTGGTVVALLAGPRGPLGGFWRPAPSMLEPEPWQLAGLVTAGLVEATGFGLALAVLVLGRPVFARLATTPGRAIAAQVATAWLLGSWWPHSALHLHFGPRPSALVGLELGFHGGSIVAGVVLVWVMLTGTRASSRLKLRLKLRNGSS